MSSPKKRPLSPAQIETVARLFGVLSEPSRLTLLETLSQGPMSVNELVDASGMKQANVSKHLAILHNQRLVKRQRDGITVRYQIADPTVFSLCNLVCGKMERDARQAAAVFTPEI